MPLRFMANSWDNHPEEESQNHVLIFLKVVPFDIYLIVLQRSIRTFEKKKRTFAAEFTKIKSVHHDNQLEIR